MPTAVDDGLCLRGMEFETPAVGQRYLLCAGPICAAQVTGDEQKRHLHGSPHGKYLLLDVNTPVWRNPPLRIPGYFPREPIRIGEIA